LAKLKYAALQAPVVDEDVRPPLLRVMGEDLLPGGVHVLGAGGTTDGQETQGEADRDRELHRARVLHPGSRGCARRRTGTASPWIRGRNLIVELSYQVPVERILAGIQIRPVEGWLVGLRYLFD
jgi:hypothetical protein